MRRADDIATCMWYTGIEPFTTKAVPIARNLRDRTMQRALMQFFKPEDDHYHTVANPAAGEPPGERGAGPVKTGYRPGRATQRRRPGKNRSGPPPRPDRPGPG